MKKILLLLISIFIVISTYSHEWSVFVNKNGEFKLLNEKSDVVSSSPYPQGSFAYYVNCLGYSDNEIINRTTQNLDFIGQNPFNEKIIFLMSRDTTKTDINTQDVQKYLSECGNFSRSDFIENLEEGIENKNIKMSFVEKSLGVKAYNNTIIDKMHGMVYYFEKGKLIRYKNDNGLAKEAEYVKAEFPYAYTKIESNAKKYYNSDISITEYINGQCKYLMMIPVDYIGYCKNTDIDYNFALLYSILYNGISLDKFSFFVPTAELSSSVNNYIIMSYHNYIFTFKDKILISSE